MHGTLLQLNLTQRLKDYGWWRMLAAASGPALFFGLWLSYPNYAGLGVLLWLTIYWATGPVPVVYTALVPIFGFGLIGVDLVAIFASFVHPAILLILAPVFMVLAAAHCGLMERLALFFIKLVGTGVRLQVLFWLMFSMTISFFAADIVVAITLTPIVVQMLDRAGYHTIKDMAASKSAMLLIIAVAIGASLGGILTPMAGGQAAITWTVLNKALGGEVTAWSFTTRMMLPVFGSMVIAGGIFALLPIDKARLTFAQKWTVGPWTVHEMVVAVLLALTVGLPYVRPWLPISLPWIYAILLAVVLLIRIPTLVKGRDGSVYCWSAVLPFKGLLEFPLNTFAVWPIAMSVSTLIGVTGTGERIFDLAGQFWTQDTYLAMGAWVAFCMVLAQAASDTGSAGMLSPVLLGVLTSAGVNPVLWIMATGFTVNMSVMMPTATGTMGVLLALGGRNHWMLPAYGFVVALACGVFAWLFWAFVLANGFQFWQTLDVIK